VTSPPGPAPKQPAGRTPLAPWRAIRADILSRIQSGDWGPGSYLPKEVELAASYGCSRSTVARALRDLAEAGFLERRRKGGTRIAENPVRKARLDVPLLAEAILRAGHTPSCRTLRAGMRPLPAPVARRLGRPAGIPVFEVLTLHLADDRPHFLEHRYIDPRAAPGVEGADLTASGIDVWLLHNAPFSRLEIALSAVPARGEVARALDLPPQSPCLLMARTSWRRDQPLGLLLLYHAEGVPVLAHL
jgi:GntR family transcriptional regulator, histidine utilization repressor